MKARKQKLVAAFVLALCPFLAYGAVTDISDVSKLIDTATGWMFGILLALAVLFIIVSAYQFLGSGVDEKRVTSAKNQLLYAVIAIVVALLAKTVIPLVQTILK